jgi:hypothetical protein
MKRATLITESRRIDESLLWSSSISLRERISPKALTQIRELAGFLEWSRSKPPGEGVTFLGESNPDEMA